LIEGVILAAYAIQARVAFIFLRAEYKMAARRMRQAVQEAHAKGWLGRRILGTDFDLEVHIHGSAGRYICGEETALLNSLEGRRATPRSKPPFPLQVGLWGRPALVNNVETLCNVPAILNNGAEWFKGLGRGDDAGTKLYGASGKLKRPGLWELPMGTTAREIIEETRRRNARRSGFTGFSTGRRFDAFSDGTALGCPLGLRFGREGRKPSGNGHDDRSG
jgi:NADH-quinone oxidoreductase subunit F